ncbi:hypothetical protein ABZS66_19170 [Dactylosporangium sp. NPDC005572]|uniref:hypothetical protein n=1 Tax=Dactylosporangium sp. NPDC005572 TaxID=3156889 RepID=UPI0033A42E59
MPWRGPSYPGEFPSLGWLNGEWIERHCVIPDGDRIGDPYLLTDEMWTFLTFHYRLRPKATVEEWQAAWAYRRSQLVRPQKWGKGPLTAAMICAEAIGPVRFAGWAEGGERYRCADHGCGCGWEYVYEPGEPMGRPWPRSSVWIQVTATSEDQTDNVWRVLLPMISAGPLANVIPDLGKSDINVPGGGLIEVVTSSGRARLGQRITFAVQDETHCWLESNGGWKLADNQRRNLSGTGGRAVETTNAWDPSEQSVAQRTNESSARDVHRDHRIPPRPSLQNKAERRRALRIAYGDSMGPGKWVNMDRIDGEAVEIAEKDPGQALRFYWNIPDAGAGEWLDGEKWDALARPRNVPDGTPVVGGLDGSDTDDWTAIRLETEDGYQFTPTYGPDHKPCIWNPADHGGQVPRLEVAAAVDEIFERYDVVRFMFDPPDWKTEGDGWAAKFGEKRVVRFETYRSVQMHAAVERLHTDVLKADSTFTHDGCVITKRHVRNARKAARTGRVYVLKKASPKQKIDAAVTSVIAHEAAGDVTAAKLWPKPKVKSKMIVRR